jgi:lanosterol synthase
MLTRAHEFLESQQIRDEPEQQKKMYRQSRAGAWAFSNRVQGYTVSDCTAEGLVAVLHLQGLKSGSTHLFPPLVDRPRQYQSIDILLTMQNATTGGFSSYEPRRGNATLMESLNAAEVFGRIMVEYDYCECTTAVILALHEFSLQQPGYRYREVEHAIKEGLRYIRDSQKEDGSWYGSWGICFTYAMFFTLTALGRIAGETCGNSARVRSACEFLVSKQARDGGWGESYRACEIGEWVDHPDGSQVVMTAWVLIGLMEAGYGEIDQKGWTSESVVGRGIKLIMARQQRNGEWLQEGIEGVFNKSW